MVYTWFMFAFVWLCVWMIWLVGLIVYWWCFVFGWLSLVCLLMVQFSFCVRRWVCFTLVWCVLCLFALVVWVWLVVLICGLSDVRCLLNLSLRWLVILLCFGLLWVVFGCLVEVVVVGVGGIVLLVIIVFVGYCSCLLF